MATYAERGQTIEVKQVADLTKAEVRLFCYFLTKKQGYLTEKKYRKFKAYFEQGNLPEEMGLITQKGDQAFCIRETHPSYYVLYTSESDDAQLVCWIRKILATIKK